MGMYCMLCNVLRLGEHPIIKYLRGTHKDCKQPHFRSGFAVMTFGAKHFFKEILLISELFGFQNYRKRVCGFILLVRRKKNDNMYF